MGLIVLSHTIMRVFVDCEFTDFIECELISLALVADDGREFYGERSDCCAATIILADRPSCLTLSNWSHD